MVLLMADLENPFPLQMLHGLLLVLMINVFV